MRLYSSLVPQFRYYYYFPLTDDHCLRSAMTEVIVL